MTPLEKELQRRVLEARARLLEGFTTQRTVDGLVRRITQKRGGRAAAQLRACMREKWQIRRTRWNEKIEARPS